MMLGVAVAALVAPFAAMASQASADKGTYLVMSTHEPGACMKSMQAVAKDQKLAKKVEWGCMSGDHTAYLMTTANSPEDAIKQLPESERANAKAVKVVKTSEALKKLREKGPG
jgi:hypothetical protein